MAKINRQATTQPPVAKNDNYRGTITDLTYQGMGVLKADNYPIFVADTLPTEEVTVVITKVLKNYAFGRLVTRHTVSTDRYDLADKAVLTSGLAPLAHLTYEAQLAFKHKLITDLCHKAHLNLEIAPVMGMTNPTHYRNKSQVPVQMVNGLLTSGCYRRGSHKLTPLEDFYLQDPAIDSAVVAVRDVLRDFGVTAYDETTRRGTVRHIMVRRGRRSGELMVVLITKAPVLPQADNIVAAIRERLPEVTSINHNVNKEATNTIMGKKTTNLWGESVIHDQLMGLNFRIGAQSFYQVNPVMTEKLYELAIDQADLQPTDTVIDAYSGIGTISLAVAKHVKLVLGVENVPEAVVDAEMNAALNDITNAEFSVADAPRQMATWQEQGLQPDVVFVDPPRKGLTEEAITAMVGMAPKKVVYISCNPATLIRDIASFQAQGYMVAGPVQPVDQFPQTTHVETVTVLVKK